MSSSEVKNTWLRLQNEINEAHIEVNSRIVSSKNPGAFYNYLQRHHENLNHFQPYETDVKIGHYGKVIIVQLLFADNGFLFIETAYYPTAPNHWGKRISVDSIDTYSNHYMERLIERKNISTLQELKTEIITRKELFDNTQFTNTEGGLNIVSEFLIVYRDLVVFCDSELDDNGIAKMVRKSLITNNEFKGNQENIINYILDEFQSDACLLTTYEIPRTINEAKKILEDTKKRLSIRSQIEIVTKEAIPNGYRANKKQIKQFTKYLEHYDPSIF